MSTSEEMPHSQEVSDRLKSRTRDTFQELAARFDLPYSPGDPGNQDWELIVADPEKISWFVDEFEQLDAPARYVLAELLMASFDEAAQVEAFPEKEWDRFWVYVKRDFEHLSPIVAYWAVDDETGSWAVGPFLRESLRGDSIPPPAWPF